MTNDTDKDVLLEYCLNWKLLRKNETKLFSVTHACSVFVDKGKSLGAHVAGEYVGCLAIPSAAFREQITINVSSVDRTVDRLSCQYIQIGDTPVVRQPTANADERRNETVDKALQYVLFAAFVPGSLFAVYITAKHFWRWYVGGPRQT